MWCLDKLKYINCGVSKRILIPNETIEFIVAEVKINSIDKNYNKAIIDYCVNVDSNDFDFFKTLTFQLYKVTQNGDLISVGPERLIIVTVTVDNIQSFFIYDNQICKEDSKYIAIIRAPKSLIGNGTIILNNSNLRVRIF